MKNHTGGILIVLIGLIAIVLSIQITNQTGKIQDKIDEKTKQLDSLEQILLTQDLIRSTLYDINVNVYDMFEIIEEIKNESDD